MSKALAGASAPYLAEVIHNMTLDPTREGGVNIEANLMAHAVLGAVVAQINGNSALAGASGAAMGEYIAQQMYPGINREDLTEEQRQTISALGTLASGLAGGLAGGSTADAVAGAQAGKNALENNALNLGSALPSGLEKYGSSASSMHDSMVKEGKSPEEIASALSQHAKGDLPEGANIAKVIVEGYQDGVLIAGAWYLGPAASVGKVIGGGVLSWSANSGYQYYDLSKSGNENKSWDYIGNATSFATGMLAPGRDVWANTTITMGGTLYTDGMNGVALTGSGLGALFGGAFGKFGPFSGEVNDIFGSFGGEFISNEVKEAGKKK